MRLLIDECIDEELRRYFPDHDCQTARYAGLKGLENGELLNAADAAGFDVLLTLDRGIAFQQNLAGRRLAVVVFHVKSSLLSNILPLIPACLDALKSVKPGQVFALADD